MGFLCHLLHAVKCSAMQRNAAELKPQQHVSRKRERFFPLFFLLLLNRHCDERPALLEGSGSETGRVVCLCHVQCVHSCTTGLLNQPALLNIAVLFTQERRAAGASRATAPPPPPRPLSLPLASLSSACSRDATSVETYAQRTRTQFEPPVGRLVYVDAAERQVCHRCTNTHLSEG